MTTWSTGRGILAERLNERATTFDELLAGLTAAPPARVPGTAVYMARNSKTVPYALLHNLKHNKVLHERVLLLAIVPESQARMPDAQRLKVEEVAPAMFRVVARHGFAEDPEVPAVLDLLRARGLDVDVAHTTFFLGRETLIATNRPGMAIWRERLFSRLARNAQRATHFFRLPPDRVCELGAEIEL